MQFHRYMATDAFARELDALHAFHGRSVGAGLLESLEEQGLLFPRLRIRYPDPVARRFWSMAHEHWGPRELRHPIEPDGPRWDAAVELDGALYRWRNSIAYGPSINLLDDPAPRFSEFIQNPSAATFEAWLDMRVDVSNDVETTLFDGIFYHFSTSYDGHHLDRIVFKKRYDHICAEWLGGLTVLKHRSKILGEQLGTHLEQLVSLGFLRSYTLTPAESRGGFVLTFRPGDQFKADYRTFYARRSTDEIKFTFHDENREIADPHRVTYLFMEKRTGRKPDGTSFVSSKDVQTAKDLLGHLNMAQIPEFLDYALAEAGKTRFDLQTLGGIRQYLQGYLETLERRRSGKAAAEARRAEERQTQLRLDYDQYRRGEVQRLFDSLPANEQASIEALARSKLSAGGPISDFMGPTLLRVEKLRLTAELHPGRIAGFEQWSASRAD